MNSIEVKTNPAYRVVIGTNELDKLGEHVRTISTALKTLVVTDNNVAGLYLDRAVKALQAEGFEVTTFVFEAGEQSKTPQTYLQIIQTLGENGFKRTDAVVALGGGVAGDLAGFAAATYMRGIDLIQVPTTLLAMIDSSIGGKTGVDLTFGKNLLGAFYQPKCVVIDTDVLRSLPDDEWKNGLGEGVKYACLAGGEVAQILSCGLDENSLQRFVYLCASYKAEIVARDEKEGGLRMLLNLGHTLGHALEKHSRFTLPHGVAVACGIERIAFAACAHNELAHEDYEVIKALLAKYRLNYGISQNDEILSEIAMDKKAQGRDRISVVTIAGIGSCKIKQMSFEEFKNYIMTE